MKNRNALVWMVAMSGVLAAGAAQAASPASLGSLLTGSYVKVGPEGDFIVGYRHGDEITLRKCVVDTTQADIESDAGCKGTLELKLSEKDFRTLWSSKLPEVVKSTNLSAAQKDLLEKALTNLPDLDQDRKDLADLNAQLAKNKQQEKDFPEDFDSKRRKDLESKIQCINDRDKSLQPIVHSKDSIATLQNQIVAALPGVKIARQVKYSKQRDTVEYNVMNAILDTPACNVSNHMPAKFGDICSVKTAQGLVLWKLEEGGLRDLKSGIVITANLGSDKNQYDAENLCQGKGMRLPTGWSTPWNGKSGVPNQDSEWVTLEKDGIRQVAADMGHWYWSSSVHPNYPDYAFFFLGGLGDVYNSLRYFNVSFSVRCVAGR